MVKLKPGVTGFYGNTEPPYIDFKAYKQVVYAIAIELRMKVTKCSSEPEEYNDNFYRAILKGDKKLWVLCNMHYPIIALSDGFHYSYESDDERCGYYWDRFIEIPSIIELVEKISGFKCLTAEEFNQPVTGECIRDLWGSELNQIKYWKPKTISEILFNFWD